VPLALVGNREESCKGVKMTSLGGGEVYRKKGYSIFLGVSGDLSHSYDLLPTKDQGGDWRGVGIHFDNLAKAKKWLDYAVEHGWKRTVNHYEAGGIGKSERYKNKYGYLSYEEAKPYLESAYGERAEEYKKRLAEERRMVKV
jgi:hypothetical protein